MLAFDFHSYSTIQLIILYLHYINANNKKNYFSLNLRAFLKNFKFFYFFLYFKIIFFLVFLYYFDALISKIILKNKKIYYFDIFPN